ncbi:MAG: RagB/SusD family nutrient uptake outer membrane protein [Muribaculaceae bacterium]|nr:RagB/SusD family nutrient uptake outer membrane protein [Muribaculaceae bacterium]
MKLNKILIPSLMVGTLASCSIDEQYYSQTTVDNFITSKANIEQMVYRPFYHWQVLINHEWDLNEFGADCLIRPARCDGSSTGFSASTERKRNHQVSPDDGTADTAFLQPLEGISRCLDVIANLETIDYAALGLTEEDRNDHIGQMHGLMGHFYVVGLDWIGGLPIYESNDDPLRPRSTAKQTFDKAEEILKMAIEELPVRSDLHLRVSGSMKKAAAAMILARLYFNAESYIGVPMYDKAAEICQDIIDQKYGPYEFEPRWQDTYGWGNHTASDIIWGVPASYEQNFKTISTFYSTSSWYPRYIQDYLGLQTNLRSGGNTYSLAPSRDPEYKLYKETRPDIKLGSPYEKFDDGDMRKRNFRVFDYENNDYEGMFFVGELYDERYDRACHNYRAFQKGEVTVIYDKVAGWSQLVENGGTYASKEDLPSNSYDGCADENDGVRMVKFPIPDEAHYTMYGTNALAYMRLSEAYLTLAECKFRLGDKATAAKLINDVRRRYFEGGNDPNPATESNLDKWRILDEWMIEFLCEGRRRIDLIRWGVYHTEKWWSHENPTGDKNECRFPISNGRIAVNTLTKQNPGYGGNELSPEEI